MNRFVFGARGGFRNENVLRKKENYKLIQRLYKESMQKRDDNILYINTWLWAVESNFGDIQINVETIADRAVFWQTI